MGLGIVVLSNNIAQLVTDMVMAYCGCNKRKCEQNIN